MKTTKIIMILGFLAPTLLQAQWSMVRFDSLNVFNHAFTATPSTVMLTGLDMTGGSFFMRTNDGGMQWDSIVINSSGISHDLRTLYFVDANTGFAGGYKNNLQVLLKTTDNGTTWNDISPDPLNVNAISSVYFPDALNGYAASGDLIYKTQDGGSTWTTHVTPVTISSVAFADVNNGMACGQMNGMATSVKTSDGGLTWTTAFSPVSLFGNLIKVDVVGADQYWVTLEYTNMLYRTMDGGSTWDSIAVTPVFDMIQDFDFITSDRGRVVSWMGEIYYTIDGGQSWILEYSTAQGAYGPAVFLYSLSFNGNTGYVSGSNGLVKKVIDEATSLSEPGESDIWNVYPNPAKGNSVITIDAPNSMVRIHTLSGALVFESLTGKNRQEIKLPELWEGMYLVTVISGSNTETKKLIISNR